MKTAAPNKNHCLFPTLSTIKPNRGARKADMRYGIAISLPNDY